MSKTQSCMKRKSTGQSDTAISTGDCNEPSKSQKLLTMGKILHFFVPMKNDTDNDAKTISINFATAAACNAVQAPITTIFSSMMKDLARVSE